MAPSLVINDDSIAPNTTKEKDGDSSNTAEDGEIDDDFDILDFDVPLYSQALLRKSQFGNKAAKHIASEQSAKQ